MLGRKLTGLPQFRDCIGVIVLTHEREAKRVVYIRIVRVNRHGLAQKIDAFLVQTTHAVEIGKVDERGREVLIEPQGRPILVLRLCRVTKPCLQ